MVAQNLRRAIILLSFLLFPIFYNYLSPALMIQGAAENVMTASVVFWGLFFLTSIFVGRAGCAYICPFGGFQTMLYRVVEMKSKQVKRSWFVKYAIWAVWMGVFFYVLINAGGYKSANMTYSTENFFSTDSVRGLILYYVLVGIVGLFAIIFGKMGFCKFICPFSVFNIIGTKINKALKLPTFYLDFDRTKCTSCRQCSKACPMGIKMPDMAESKDIVNAECILCGECCTACKKQALHRKYGKHAAFEARESKDIKA